MRKSIKIILIILVAFLVDFIVDTAQAKIFNNRPFFKITQSYNGGNVYQKDIGVLVYTYNFIDGEKKTVFRWEKYAPPVEKPVDLEVVNTESYKKYDKVIDNVKLELNIPNEWKYEEIEKDEKNVLEEHQKI